MKNISKYTKLSFSILFFIFSSCQKDILAPDPVASTTNIFDDIWKTVDERYCFFEQKKINWDSVKTNLRPLIVNENISNDSLFRVVARMLNTLRDGHVNIKAPFNFSRNWDWYLDYPPNFDANIVERNYWKKDYYATGSLINQYMDTQKEVGYIYYGSFANDVSENNLDDVLKRFKDTKGLIIDVRDNGGGDITNAITMAKRFASNKFVCGYWHEKKSKVHNDFDTPIAVQIDPTKPE